MKFLKRFILIILLLILALIGIAYVLPDSAHVEREIRIDAPPEAVFPYVNNFHRFNEWSPWAEMDPDMQYDFSGPDSGVGARMAWESDKPEVGSGSNLITQSKPPNRVTTRLEFGGQGISASYFQIEAAGDGSVVTWGLDTEFGNNYIERYFGLMMDRWVGQDFEKGLQNLKTQVEKQDG